jgi:hypothetical protein
MILYVLLLVVWYLSLRPSLRRGLLRRLYR